MLDQRLLTLSVDLDPLTAYYAIHGLGAPPPNLRHTIMRHAVPRFEELFAELGVKATFFIVGHDLDQSTEARAIVKRLAKAGHEIANHTFSHPYDLSRLSSLSIDEEIRRAHLTIVEHIGEEHAPVGFRAPGYTINSKVARALSVMNYRYDSSVFPSPPYYAAKAAVMAAMSFRGRRSASILGDPRALFAPTDPYVLDLDSPWRKGSSGIVELPITVIPWLKLPAIGTSLAISPPWLRSLLIDHAASRPLFNLEFHGIDLSDATADRIPTELAGRQPDLRVPFSNKRDVFVDVITELKATHRVVPLKDAAELFANAATD